MKKTKILFGVLILTILSGLLVAFAMQPTPEELLVQAIETMKGVESVHAVTSFNVDTPEESGNGTVEVWAQMNGDLPNVRLEVLDSSMADIAGMVAVTDGENFWVYNPTENSVLVGTAEELKAVLAARMEGREFDHEAFDQAELEARKAELEAMKDEAPATTEELVAKLLEYVTAERNGRANIGAASTTQLRLIPIPEKMPDELRLNGGLFNVWIRTDGAPVGVEYTGGAIGEGSVQVTTLDLNIELDAALFTFDIPDGANIITIADLEALAGSFEESVVISDAEVVVPTALPEGAMLLETTEINGAVVQRYSLGEGSFVVAMGGENAGRTPNATLQETSVNNQPAQLYADQDANRTLLTWQENGITYWVGGDLSADQAMMVAESLE
jgi:outer membrane lipoprotein-sorting protein